ncbi:MAG: ferritin family protein [Salinivirgaceae bacterium]
MLKTIKGSKTEQNLLKAFAGESQARNRYEFFASVAKKEGYEQIAAIFQETANQEKEHAKRFFKFLEGGMTEITASYPAGIIGTTAENLKAAAEGENEEWTALYPEFSEIAKEEGFPEVAVAFKMIAKVEAEHERRYLKLLQNISEDKVFMKDGKVWWKCLNCGYVYESVKALETCPACLHPKAFMQLKEENY